VFEVAQKNRQDCIQLKDLKASIAQQGLQHIQSAFQTADKKVFQQISAQKEEIKHQKSL
jgi:hypothetical protein